MTTHKTLQVILNHFVLRLFFSCLFMVLAFFSLNTYLQYVEQISSIEKRLERSLATSSREIIQLIENGEMDFINYKLRFFAIQSDIQPLYYNFSGPGAYVFERLPEGTRSGLISKTIPLNYLDRNLGSLTYYTPKPTITSTEINATNALIATVALSAFFAVLLVTLKNFLRRNITHPVDSLCEQLEEGALKTPPQEEAREFSWLRENIQNYQKQIVDQKLHEAYAQMARQMAHDIKSPLSALRVFTKNMQNLPEDQAKLIAMAIERIQIIAGDLNLKKLSTNAQLRETFQPKLPMVQFKEIIHQVLSELTATSRVAFQSTLDLSDQTELISDGVELSRILTNLITNAIEAFDKPKNLLSISVERSDDHITIHIKDNGKGIPAEVLPHLWRAGYSFGKETLPQSGTGLGLHHCKNAVEAWQGSCRIDSVLHHGTQLSVALKFAKSSRWGSN